MSVKDMPRANLARDLMGAAAVAFVLTAACASAQPAGVTIYEVKGSFEDVAFDLEAAIIGRGLVVDHVSHVGEMLNRTAVDVGATQQVYAQADVYLFCSATLSRRMMEADPTNIAHCPYGIFLYELADSPGSLQLGFRQMPDGPMQEVESLLDQIAREAAGLD